ncbi:MAG: hypothetical protein LC796_15060 [Acidobacteria bacterium]|nr:hypothetical protein [Acidobacteriota bacterium]MCA1610254.1 hypothetical protein [Acidobacteriota bacterium]
MTEATRSNETHGIGTALLAPGIVASIGLSQDLEPPFEISSSQSLLVRGTASGKPILRIVDSGGSRTIHARELLGSEKRLRFSSPQLRMHVAARTGSRYGIWELR